jgi:hypothetical protein
MGLPKGQSTETLGRYQAELSREAPDQIQRGREHQTGGSVRLLKRSRPTPDDSRIFLEITARQIVDLEVAGSSPVGHPLSLTSDALKAHDIRLSGHRVVSGMAYAARDGSWAVPAHDSRGAIAGGSRCVARPLCC